MVQNVSREKLNSKEKYRDDMLDQSGVEDMADKVQTWQTAGMAGVKSRVIIWHINPPGDIFINATEALQTARDSVIVT